MKLEDLHILRVLRQTGILLSIALSLTLARQAMAQPQSPLAKSSARQAGRCIAKGTDSLVPSGAILRVSVSDSTKLSRLTPGNTLNGAMAEPVYVGDCQLIPAGAPVRLVIDRVERVQSRKRRRLLSRFASLFRPPAQWKHRYRLVFRSASLKLPGSSPSVFSASFVRADHPVAVEAQTARSEAALRAAAKPSSRPRQRNSDSTVLLLQLSRPLPVRLPAASAAANSPGEKVMLDDAPLVLNAGTRGRFVLMDPLSASKSRDGQHFVARLVEPISAGNQRLVPAGSLLQGSVSTRVPPRRLWRAGSLHIRFSRLSLPCGLSGAAIGVISGVKADRGLRLKIGPEGTIRSRGPSKATLFFNLGVTAGISKVTDDGLQLLLEALISTATDASTAGVARYAAAGSSLTFLLTRRGADVILPKYSELEITFTRPVVLTPGQADVSACVLYPMSVLDAARRLRITIPE